jgi:hypothetical protein
MGRDPFLAPLLVFWVFEYYGIKIDVISVWKWLLKKE